MLAHLAFALCSHIFMVRKAHVDAPYFCFHFAHGRFTLSSYSKAHPPELTSGRNERSECNHLFVLWAWFFRRGGINHFNAYSVIPAWPTYLFSIGASSSSTRFYLTMPRACPRREFVLPNSFFFITRYKNLTWHH